MADYGGTLPAQPRQEDSDNSPNTSENVRGQAFMLVQSQAQELNKMLEHVQDGISHHESELDDLRAARETLFAALRGTEKIRGVESDSFEKDAPRKGRDSKGMF